MMPSSPEYPKLPNNATANITSANTMLVLGAHWRSTTMCKDIAKRPSNNGVHNSKKAMGEDVNTCLQFL